MTKVTLVLFIVAQLLCWMSFIFAWIAGNSTLLPLIGALIIMNHITVFSNRS